MRLLAPAPVLALILATPVLAQDAPFTRTPLQSIDAPADAHSVQSFLVTVAPHGTVPRHTHPGVETGYIVAGTATLSLSGEPDRVIKPGDSWAFPAGAPHGVVNTGDGPAQLVVTYVVEAGKPLSSPAP